MARRPEYDKTIGKEVSLMRRLLCIWLVVAVCVCATACADNTVAGVWSPLEPLGYYFELHEDGSCVMFNENDEWVSSGTYTAFEDHLTFTTDTGDFTWVWDDNSESMVFEAGEDTFHFRIEN